MTSTNLAPTITLANGVAMPRLGLGTSPMDDAESENAVTAALQAGYRLIDTAENYANERGVGLGIRASGIDRGEVFVTTKFNARWHGYAEAQQACAECAARLGLEYIDLLLIHWPNPQQDRYVDAWRGLVKLLEDGKVRAIGTSNFKPAHIDRLLDATGVAPHVNQLQINPRIGRAAESAYNAAHGIVTEAWAPLGRGGDILRDPIILAAAERHSRSPGQVLLRWLVQRDIVPIPKSANPQRLAENLDVFSFELAEQEMAGTAALDRNGEGAVDSDRMGH